MIDLGSLHLSCSGCGAQLLQHRKGQWVLRNAIAKFVGDHVEVRCPEQGCGADTPVPFLALVDPPKTAVDADKPARRRYLVRTGALDRSSRP